LKVFLKKRKKKKKKSFLQKKKKPMETHGLAKVGGLREVVVGE
jgi:hypothetical protein